MSKPPIPFAPETQETIQRAFHLAQERRHDVVGLEHLLLAILDEGGARRLLVGCGIKIEPLMVDIFKVIYDIADDVYVGQERQLEAALARD